MRFFCYLFCYRVINCKSIRETKVTKVTRFLTFINKTSTTGTGTQRDGTR